MIKGIEPNHRIQSLNELCISKCFVKIARRIEATIIRIYIKHNASIHYWRQPTRKRRKSSWRNHNATVETQGEVRTDPSLETVLVASPVTCGLILLKTLLAVLKQMILYCLHQ